jgi:hypothetical protein
MRININGEKFEKVRKIVADYSDKTDEEIRDFIDGGEEGWECGDDEQQKWIDNASAPAIASWIIAGIV